MNYFPHSPLKHSALPMVKSLIPGRHSLTRDILWNRPLFKAPALPSPRIAVEPLPFLAARPAYSGRRT